jgi:putative signal transducing protein
MYAVLVTTNPVLLDFARAVLTDSGIKAEVFDQHTSAIEGAIGALPRRLMVPSEAAFRARRALEAAGLGADLSPLES